MPRLRPANLDHGGHSDASFQAAADGMVLGCTSHDNASNGMSARQLEDQLGVTFKTAWLLTQKLRRSMVVRIANHWKELSKSIRRKFRSARAMHSSSPAMPAKSSSSGPSGHRSRYQSGQPRRKHAKYLDTRSGRIRLAMITGSSAASIEAFVKANVKRGATLLTDGTHPFGD